MSSKERDEAIAALEETLNNLPKEEKEARAQRLMNISSMDYKDDLKVQKLSLWSGLWHWIKNDLP